MSSLPYSEEHASIQRQVLAAIHNSQYAEEEKKKFRRLRDRFENLAKSGGGGLTARDLVRLLKQSSGVELDLEAASSFIRTWDSNEDDSLDYDEFVEMLLGGSKPSSRSARKASINSNPTK